MSKNHTKRILFFNSHRAWGGGEKWHFEMANLLAKDSYHVTIAAAKGSELAKRSQIAGLSPVEVSIGRLSFLNPFKLFKLYRLFCKVTPEAVILNLPSDLKAAGLMAWIAGVALIVYRRGSAIPIRNSMFNRFLFRYVVSDVIANSEETKRTVLAKNPHLFPRDKIHVIYNGIDLNEFDSHIDNTSYERNDSEVVLGTVGRLSYEKNQLFLIDVVSELKTNGMNCRLLIAGTGPLEMELKAYAKEKGVQDNVDFLGFQDNIPSLMATIDIFLLCSLWEGFGYVLVEAMAAMKPVVAFCSSSTPEIVCDGKTGYLVPSQDLEQFSLRILEIAGDSGKSLSLGLSGRDRVEKVFSINGSLLKLKKVLELD